VTHLHEQHVVQDVLLILIGGPSGEFVSDCLLVELAKAPLPLAVRSCSRVGAIVVVVVLNEVGLAEAVGGDLSLGLWLGLGLGLGLGLEVHDCVCVVVVQL